MCPRHLQVLTASRFRVLPLCKQSAFEGRTREAMHVKKQCSPVKYQGTGHMQQLLFLLYGFLLWKPLASPYAFAEGTDSVPSIKPMTRFPGLVTGGEDRALWPASLSSHPGRRSAGCNEHSLLYAAGNSPPKQTRTLRDPDQVSSSSNQFFSATTGPDKPITRSRSEATGFSLTSRI